MNRRLVVVGGLGVLAVLLAVGGLRIALLPPAPAVAAPPPVAQPEVDTTLAALRPSRRERPLVAIIGINGATETTDYLLPYGILRRADVADVVALATGPGPVRLYPALSVEPQATVADFDARHPEGADYVVVPAMQPDDDPAALAWIRSQADKGAVVIGVCAGAVVVGRAGLLEGRQATTRWYFIDRLREASARVEYVPDRRFVVDGRVATTTGISASLPMMLTLVEAIAGRARAEDVAAGLGLRDWDARHASEAFRFNRPFALTVIGNVAAFWDHEELGVELARGIDEISLALVADAWSRTYRSRALSFAAAPGAVESRGGLRILPDRVAADWPAGHRIAGFGNEPPVDVLDRTLAAIAARYGGRTAKVVAMQLEYPAGF